MTGVFLGAFELTTPIGQGGMAEVWGAVHPSGTRAAIKVMTASSAQDPVWRSGFLREIRATAGLNHPNIVHLFDCGVVPEAAAPLGLLPGSPWVAMERATSGDLHANRPGHWGALRRVLLAILDALAHAHARGVIHRDLKPANVLVTEDAAGPALRLTDFGIAHVGTEESALSASPTSGSGGTPEYMAPEQVTGRLAEQGPWTDLYALGCMAYTLAGGRPPFEGQSALNVAIQHVTHVAPPLVTQFPVPPGFAQWVARLMSRSPRGRYVCAADAALALARLSEGFQAPAESVSAAFALSETIAACHTMVLDLDGLEPATSTPSGAHRDPSPPVPATWETANLIRPGLADAGLGLLAVRRPPLVGRVAHRDHLWSALHAADGGAPAQLVALMGARGLGTSAVARWICERAVEVGAAEVFEARHQRTDTADDGIGAMLRRHFNALALDADATRQHIEQWVDDPLSADLASVSLWSPDGDGDGFESADERHAVVGRYLAERAQRRPVIVFIDEGQWGGDTLAFALWLLRAAVPRVLIIMAFDTSGTDISGPQSRAHWARLQVHPRVHQLTLEPLTHPVHCRLIHALLPLAPPLRAALHAHTAGYPHFANELLLYWSEEGWLGSGPDGFELAPDVDAWLPDIGTVYLRRFQRVAGGDDSAMRAVELAAVLGLRVKSAHWVAVCRAMNVALPMGFVDRLLRAGLAVHRPNGWAFSTDGAVDALRDHARAGGRYEQANLVCARVLESRGESALRYLYRARAFGELLPKMFEAVRDLMARSEHGAALTLLQLSRTPFAEVGVKPPDPRWIEARILETRALRFAVGIRPALEVLETLEPLLDVASPHIAAQLAHLRATVAGPEVSFLARHARYQDALSRYRALGDHAGAAECLHGLGLMAMLTGQFGGALAQMDAAVDSAQQAGVKSILAWALQGRALVRRFLDDPDGEQDAIDALALFRQHRSLNGMGATHFSLGDYRLAVGDLDAAERHLERARSVLEAIDSPMQVLPRIALISVMAHRGDLQAAGQALGQIELSSDDRIFNSPQVITRYHSLALWVAGAQADTQAVAHHVEVLEGFASVRILDMARRNLERARPLLEADVQGRIDALLAGWRL
jgi:serine/threonine protein kinase/tetratricopeptide (TPR) repeat protein